MSLAPNRFLPLEKPQLKILVEVIQVMLFKPRVTVIEVASCYIEFCLRSKLQRQTWLIPDPLYWLVRIGVKCMQCYLLVVEHPLNLCVWYDHRCFFEGFFQDFTDSAYTPHHHREQILDFLEECRFEMTNLIQPEVSAYSDAFLLVHTIS